jgi:alpha-L-rhamnosidase
MKMMVEYADSPVAIDTRTPRFSWEVPPAGRGRRQTAYHILVATAKEHLSPGSADLWDSGRVESTQSVNVAYAGAPLLSNLDCWWTVQVWDETGGATGFSPPRYFGTALFDRTDWQAQWIGMGAPDEPFSDPDAFQLERVTPEVAGFEPDPRAPLLRRAFVLDRPVKRARVFVCGLGLFELRLNGRKVGDDVLATPRTDFRKRVLYCTYDVADQLQQGDNVLGLALGNGWYNGQKKYWGWQMQWHGSPRAILQLELEFTDGTHQRVVSDGAWRGSWSPITFNCLFDGEHVDARLAQPGWDAPGFDDSAWRKVNSVPAPGGRLDPVPHEQERMVETIRSVSVKEPEPGVFVFDMGRNITGWVRLVCEGGSAGDTMTLRFGEAQYETGALNASSNNAACQEDRYTLRGGAEEVFEPRFTFHGFQFVEVTGYPGCPGLEAVTGRFVRTAVPQTGSFECGHELINRIHRCTLQSQLCNVQMGVPTDDTQRPERQGWGADAWGTAREALYNLWMPRVYRKWIRDFCDQQDDAGMLGMIVPQAGANEDLVWSAAFVLIPWWQYLHCGDRRILAEIYPALQRYLGYLQRVGVKEVSTATSEEVVDKLLSISGARTRFSTEADRGHLQVSQWGDHLSTAEGFASRSNLPLSIATAFYYQDVAVMAEIAAVLGHDEDAGRYSALADEIRAAFNERFFDPALGYYDTGVQSAQAWALAFGLAPEEHRKRIETYFMRSIGQTQRRLTTGYAGTRYAIEALSMVGRDDMVWKLAVATEYPSWGYMLRLNRTTSCERWDGESGSLNHAPLGAAIDEWFYWGLAGIRPDASAPGFETIIFKPYLPEELPWARASLDTPRGRIVSEWRQDADTACLTFTVPANCAAVVHVPSGDPTTIFESGLPAARSEGVELLSVADGESRFTVGSGTYQFAFNKAAKG